MALDIDNWTEAITMLHEHDINLQALYDAPDAVVIDSGRAGHGKLLYTMPFGASMPSRKITNLSTGKVVFELRCASANGMTVQDVLPSALLHPITQQTYRWAGRGHFTRTPVIPTELLKFWSDLNERDSERTVTNGTVDTSWDEIKRALYFISADSSRDDWISVGMALHYAGVQTQQEAQAFYLWDEWSQQSESKYPGQRELGAQWASFKSRDDGIKLGTLFHLARSAGYRPPEPDISQLFKQVEAANPVEYVQSLRSPAPKLNPDLFPELLHRRAFELSASINVDIAQPLWAGMAAASGAVDARIRLELAPGYRVPPVLWVMSIGSPATKKTPASSPMFTALQDIEIAGKADYVKRFAEWELLSTLFQKSKVARDKFMDKPEFILASAAAGAPDMTILPAVTKDPGPAPVPLRLAIKDVTSQKMARMLAERPSGMIAIMDEMKSWTDRVTNPASGDDRSTWTVSYEAKHHVIDRVGEKEPIYADNFALSIFGNLQPAVYRDVQRKLGNDGLLQRFIQVPLGNEPFAKCHPIPDIFTSQGDWDDLIRSLYKLPVRVYRLDQQAYESFQQFQAWYLENKRLEQLLQSQTNLYLEAYGKLEGLLGRVALVMHLIESPAMEYVSGDLMNRAILILKSYVVPAYRYALSEIAGSIEETFDYWLFRYIVQMAGDSKTLTLSDITRSARRQLENMHPRDQKQAVIDGMQRIIDIGWAIKIRDDKVGMEWAINPKLSEADIAYKREVIRAKQAQIDAAADIARSNGAAPKRNLAKGYSKWMDGDGESD
jgi:hypothetical protein